MEKEENMRNLYLDTRRRLDFEKIRAEVERLTELEKGQTSSCYRRAAAFAAELLREKGFGNVETLAFPADGKTVFHDLKMPLAWEAETGSLRIPRLEKLGCDPVVADYRRHPFHLVKGSCALSDRPLEVRIVRETQMLAGEDVRDALILLEPMTRPQKSVIRMLLDLGARGFVSDYLKGRYETPDAFEWTAGATGSDNWHVTAEDRPFIGFSISPKTGDLLREQSLHAPLSGIVECDARRFEGTFPCVTALIPGKSSREIWCVAHLFEPLADDDSLGVVSAMEAARQILEDGSNTFSVRLIFSLELYGLTAYAASRGATIADQVIGACNFDSQLCRNSGFILVTEAGPGVPFCGNLLARLLAAEASGTQPFPEIIRLEKGAYFDDLVLNDSTVGVPSLWFLGRKGERWHNSSQDISYLDRDATLSALALNGAFVKALASPKKKWVEQVRTAFPARMERIRREMADVFPGRKAEGIRHLAGLEQAMFRDFSRLFPGEEFFLEIPELEESHLPAHASSGWREYASGIIPARKRCGFPYAQTAIPPEDRCELPDGVIYGILANVFSGMDGRKTLSQIIREAEYQRGALLDETTVKNLVNRVCFLSGYGYVSLDNRGEIRGPEIVEALRQVGIGKGDLLLVHSSLSGCGHVPDGASGIVEAFRQAVGKDGTVLFPAFNYPYVNLGGTTNRSAAFRPFSPENRSDIWTGKVPRYVLDHCPDALRSRHITHSWTGFGPEARACLDAHEPCDAPASAQSPLKKALERNGKVVHFGTSLSSTTFLHLLEDELDLPGLGDAVCKLKNPDGSGSYAVIRRHLPGDREFYHHDSGSRFFRLACERGLRIRSVRLQAGAVRAIELRELYRIGRELLAEDRNLLSPC